MVVITWARADWIYGDLDGACDLENHKSHNWLRDCFSSGLFVQTGHGSARVEDAVILLDLGLRGCDRAIGKQRSWLCARTFFQRWQIRTLVSYGWCDTRWGSILGGGVGMARAKQARWRRFGYVSGLRFDRMFVLIFLMDGTLGGAIWFIWYLVRWQPNVAWFRHRVYQMSKMWLRLTGLKCR